MCYQSNGVVGRTLCERMLRQIQSSTSQNADADDLTNAEYRWGAKIGPHLKYLLGEAFGNHLVLGTSKTVGGPGCGGKTH